jgi:predicted RNA-binding protein with PIN domain
MSEKYILDGYNVIGKIPKLREIKNNKGLANSREALARMLADIKYYRTSIEFVVVFDGKTGELPSCSKTSLCGISCLFTKSGEEADDYIGIMLRNIRDKTGVVVISNDNKVYNKCKTYGVEILQPSALQELIKKQPRSANTDDKKISQQEANDITKWYKEKLKGK